MSCTDEPLGSRRLVEYAQQFVELGSSPGLYFGRPLLNSGCESAILCDNFEDQTWRTYRKTAKHLCPVTCGCVESPHQTGCPRSCAYSTLPPTVISLPSGAPCSTAEALKVVRIFTASTEDQWKIWQEVGIRSRCTLCFANFDAARWASDALYECFADDFFSELLNSTLAAPANPTDLPAPVVPVPCSTNADVFGFVHALAATLPLDAMFDVFNTFDGNDDKNTLNTASPCARCIVGGLSLYSGRLDYVVSPCVAAEERDRLLQLLAQGVVRPDCATCAKAAQCYQNGIGCIKSVFQSAGHLAGCVDAHGVCDSCFPDSPCGSKGR